MEWPSALALGTLAAFLFSLKQINPELRIEWSLGSAIVFVIGTLVSWFLARAVFRMAEQPALDEADAARKGRKNKMILFVSVLSVATVCSLAYGLKDVSPAKRLDVIIGTGCAFLAIAAALYGFWRLVQFLERHGLPEEEEEEEEEEVKKSPPSEDRSE